MPENQEPIDRDDQFKKDKQDRELYPHPDSVPDGQQIISPTTIVLKWPSFDLQSSEFGLEAGKAYLKYMLHGGPRSFKAKIDTERNGFLAVDFGARVGDREIWDTWDYHGPLKVSFESTFSDKPIQGSAEGLSEALYRCFLAGGYEETSEEMRPFEEILSPLKCDMTHKLLAFSADPLLVPLGNGKAASMRKEDYAKAVMEAHPQVYIHWRGF